ncbi:hypothetical protein BZB76_5373 [Actinomadura pelletieri DSM 43383]|uniref:Lactococcin 972 family bacteriocin n=1 Tax=Actinomadura pelletieri DSM 43383 TaxID=1120940 RepID=A0A495QGI0_9ACTN|nr:hypothetical protein BZB76_5373 [Actinomadura pelletieri DSM 43383]
MACYGYTQKYYAAMARCNNRKVVQGATRRMGSGVWSYAYCTSVNSSLTYGYHKVWG